MAPAEGRWACGLWRACHWLMGAFFALAALVQVLGSARSPFPVTISKTVCLPPVCVLGAYCSVQHMKGIQHRPDAGTQHDSTSLMLTFWHSRSTTQMQKCGWELLGLVIIAAWLSLCRGSSKNPVAGRIQLATAIIVALFPFISWVYIYIHKEMRSSWPTHCKTVI
ncbi:transmembrane protein 220 isoform X2 [Hippopotamus amphibius kiboko]|uniref:transmembrane protein 220 isoform X2 n=1 Tax=Hippopotamus amphibius kiboko TaxID=575201 RepID=UPI0025989CFF|nr:transmembrane protein 220 isoform X2 [Hippopotamus amphibius kiboko]